MLMCCLFGFVFISLVVMLLCCYVYVCFVGSNKRAPFSKFVCIYYLLWIGISSKQHDTIQLTTSQHHNDAPIEATEQK